MLKNITQHAEKYMQANPKASNSALLADLTKAHGELKAQIWWRYVRGIDMFPQNVEFFRNRAGYSQSRLAEICGLTSSHISQIERGTKKNPSFNTVIAISMSLGVRPEDLFMTDTAKRKDVPQILPAV